MSWEFCENTQPTANKEYRCDACEWLLYVGADFLDEDELALYEKAKSEKFKILKGTKYDKCEGKYDGEFSVFRARPEINEICLRYEVYQD